MTEELPQRDLDDIEMYIDMISIKALLASMAGDFEAKRGADDYWARECRQAASQCERVIHRLSCGYVIEQRKLQEQEDE